MNRSVAHQATRTCAGASEAASQQYISGSHCSSHHAITDSRSCASVMCMRYERTILPAGRLSVAVMYGCIPSLRPKCQLAHCNKIIRGQSCRWVARDAKDRKVPHRTDGRTKLANVEQNTPTCVCTHVCRRGESAFTQVLGDVFHR